MATTLILAFSFIWLTLLVSTLCTRVNSYSVLGVSSLLYSSPIFWSSSNDPYPLLIWSCVLIPLLPLQLYFSRRAQPFEIRVSNGNIQEFRSITYNIILILLFLLIVVRSRGVSVFFEGKYGSIPGGNINLYYIWNSALLIVASNNAVFAKMKSWKNMSILVQIFFVFVGGDRTIPVLYAIVVFSVYCRGVSPLQIATKGNPLITGTLVTLVPILAVSKSIYTLLPNSGFSVALLKDVFSKDFWTYLAQDFEPTHTHSILLNSQSDKIPYTLSDLFSGLWSFLPGSSYFGVDPHAFSLAVKHQFYSSWSDTTGVGASFWAQAWVVGGFGGVLLFFTLVALTLRILEGQFNKINNNERWPVGLSLLSIVGFYLQRNSLEQVLSFGGRYLFLFLIAIAISNFLWVILPKAHKSI